MSGRCKRCNGKMFESTVILSEREWTCLQCGHIVYENPAVIVQSESKLINESFDYLIQMARDYGFRGRFGVKVTKETLVNYIESHR